ncbi:type III polyketide synthase [Actinomadura parmotrematis]|uniref:Type III polyketide synthase n=1 Tax=Actinomadura parmotrematis TaxID=2864039 RepID=A0ABS7FZB5_9ACTN|nr:3-oxoacyl-[acyl-carrier-protein] synthase III C-terminal domain-containing protein [Actinomadura parmotrematis]MBW8485485.1 type III polyketide synthase [Actinomadura parmotrematis]
MTSIAGVGGALPPHRYPQHAIADALADACLPAGAPRGLLDRLHASAGVRFRNLALPLEDYATLGGFGAANDAFIGTATALGAEAVATALAAAGAAPDELDMLMLTTVTGVAAPSVDARLAERAGLRPDVKRLPLFGLGCVGGAAGLARVHDYLRGWPEHTAALLSVELCSLTLQRDDASIANLVAGALFGDGATAVVMRGAAHAAPGPSVVATRSHLYPGTSHYMGWQVGDGGFRVVLDPGIPDAVRTHLAADVRAFLADHGLTVRDVAAWVCHPGGPRVMDAVVDALDLAEEALAVTRRSLAEHGNMSSSSVLHVLRDTIALGPEPGTPGLLMALGPGFCSELVLLRW